MLHNMASINKKLATDTPSTVHVIISFQDGSHERQYQFNNQIKNQTEHRIYIYCMVVMHIHQYLEDPQALSVPTSLVMTGKINRTVLINPPVIQRPFSDVTRCIAFSMDR